MKENLSFNIIGMMSGTSCDGVDLVLVKYFNNNKKMALFR